MKNNVNLIKALLIIFALNSIYTSYKVLTRVELPHLSLPHLMVAVMVFAHFFLIVTLITQKFSGWAAMLFSNYVVISFLVSIAAQGVFMYLVGSTGFATTSLVSFFIIAGFAIFYRKKSSASTRE